MLKALLLLSFFLFSSLLYGGDRVTIYATKLDSNSTTVEATGGVSVAYGEYLLNAQKAIYNRDSGDLELFGNIRVSNNGRYKILGKYAKLNIAKKERRFEPFYMLDNSSQVWMSAKSGKTKENDIKISSGVVSGCNPIDPLWTMEFSSADYYAQTKWVNLYNARLYLYDIPLFYTPYFGYSLDTKRRTGLLIPSFGLSNAEGIYMQQPFYVAEQNWWDLEFLPQVRTNRGIGIYETFRFVDSQTSKGEFHTGYFEEKENYFVGNHLQNRSHYGFNFKYQNNDFINQWFHQNYEGQSGIYMDINHMNDVDYINLTRNGSRDQMTSTQILSRVNLFYNTGKNYFASYIKYYEDLTQPTNDKTLQKLPTLHYHSYLDTLLQNHILYSLDIQSNNIYRKEGKRVVQTDIKLPIGVQTNLFDEYLNLSYQANLYLQHSSFSGNPTLLSTPYRYETGYFARNYHTFKASTSLTKGYTKYRHVVDLSVSYNHSSWEKKSGYYKDVSDYCANPDNQSQVGYEMRCEFYNLSDIEDTTKIDLMQYLYDNKGKKVLFHRLSQTISYAKVAERFGELENEFEYRISDYLTLYNDMLYNYDKKRFSKIFNKVGVSSYGVSLDVSHLFKDNFQEGNRERYTSYLTTTLNYLYSSHYSYEASYNYDLQTHEKKSASIGFMYKKRCWDFGIKYAENNRPVLTNAITAKSSVYDKYIYLTVVLKPFMKPRKNSSLISYKFAD